MATYMIRRRKEGSIFSVEAWKLEDTNWSWRGCSGESFEDAAVEEKKQRWVGKDCVVLDEWEVAA